MLDPHDPRINYAPPDFNPVTDLPKGFFDFLQPLHRAFTPRQQKLIAHAHRCSPTHIAANCPITFRPPKRRRAIGRSRCRIGAWISATR